ncbi:hypothetical protein F0562_020596 [Nyssa sinensis]|uniref:Mediator of RNA polymerase II transcription subunit 32 n=1 Tax=Nyssa sinensis TaxID=561372 RepID=A0A5J5BS57_9ASTE|nr:hypothetical protein F0562_020596 [Nyssa sinensis]
MVAGRCRSSPRGEPELGSDERAMGVTDRPPGDTLLVPTTMSLAKVPCRWDVTAIVAAEVAVEVGRVVLVGIDFVTVVEVAVVVAVVVAETVTVVEVEWDDKTEKESIGFWLITVNVEPYWEGWKRMLVARTTPHYLLRFKKLLIPNQVGGHVMDNIVDALNNAYREFVAAAASVLEVKESSGGQKTAATDAALENFKQRWELFRVACDQAEEFVESVKQRIGSECLVDEATGSVVGKPGQAASTGLPPISAVRLEQMSKAMLRSSRSTEHVFDIGEPKLRTR